MSLAAIEGMRDGTLYLSTGGGWAPATDANSQGDAYADRLRALADDVGCTWLRLRPSADDWNAVLKQREKERMERKEDKSDVPHARQPHQGRLRPATPALDPVGRDAGDPKGVMKDQGEE